MIGTRATLMLVDLLGAEKSIGSPLDPTVIANNLSLNSLSKVIVALAKKEKFVPFRDCLLTMLLKVCMIAI